MSTLNIIIYNIQQYDKKKKKKKKKPSGALKSSRTYLLCNTQWNLNPRQPNIFFVTHIAKSLLPRFVL